MLARTPDGQAQADETGSVTFAGSYERSLRLAAGYAAHGVGPGQPAALLLDNSLDAVHAWSGLGLGGMIEVPVNTAYKGRFLRHVLNDSGAELIVIEDGYAARLAAVAGQLTALRTVAVRGDVEQAAALRGRFRVIPLAELEEHGRATPVPGDAGRLMAYMYTSGTTGASKGVLISHAHAYTYASREHQALIHGLPSFVAPKTPTQKVHKHLLRARGAGPEVWDREAAGTVLRRGSR